MYKVDGFLLCFIFILAFPCQGKPCYRKGILYIRTDYRYKNRVLSVTYCPEKSLK